jgi:fatty acid/phospholipid biosynthesis enzyme
MRILKTLAQIVLVIAVMLTVAISFGRYMAKKSHERQERLRGIDQSKQVEVVPTNSTLGVVVLDVGGSVIIKSSSKDSKGPVPTKNPYLK